MDILHRAQQYRPHDASKKQPLVAHFRAPSAATAWGSCALGEAGGSWGELSALAMLEDDGLSEVAGGGHPGDLGGDLGMPSLSHSISPAISPASADGAAPSAAMGVVDGAAAAAAASAASVGVAAPDRI